MPCPWHHPHGSLQTREERPVLAARIAIHGPAVTASSIPKALAVTLLQATVQVHKFHSADLAWEAPWVATHGFLQRHWHGQQRISLTHQGQSQMLPSHPSMTAAEVLSPLLCLHPPRQLCLRQLGQLQADKALESPRLKRGWFPKASKHQVPRHAPIICITAGPQMRDRGPFAWVLHTDPCCRDRPRSEERDNRWVQSTEPRKQRDKRD